MCHKIVVTFLLVVACAVSIGAGKVNTDSSENGPHDTPLYVFTSEVNSGHTGDIESQSEHRDGDVVRGQFSLVESDGATRTVEYSPDDHISFTPVIKKIDNDNTPVSSDE